MSGDRNWWKMLKRGILWLLGIISCGWGRWVRKLCVWVNWVWWVCWVKLLLMIVSEGESVCRLVWSVFVIVGRCVLKCRLEMCVIVFMCFGWWKCLCEVGVCELNVGGCGSGVVFLMNGFYY